ncbi:hypothetical protein [Actinokineospora enzanensis]|uniref:hypothetical protein n=1 Tax=Actinokineospora enzanensis TaxID=155975 RepID=UPI000376CA81|nr:hypothetical protein [Actinokineospora enzanensis]
MAGVEEIRSWIAVATEKAHAGVAAIAQASLQLDEARGALAAASTAASAAAAGSGPAAAAASAGLADVERSAGLLGEAVRALADAQHVVQAGITSVEGYAARL